MNRRHAVALALLVLCSPRLGAEAPAAPATPAAVAPFLWEVQGPGARHYLLGSVHLLPPESRPLPAALDAAYANTRALVVETDLAALASPDVQNRMLAAAREDRPGGLKARVGKKLFSKLQARATALGMPTPVCAELRAWFCALALELYPLQQARFSMEYGVDHEYFTRARDDGRPVVSLETPVFQIELFAQMPEALGKEMLEATLDEKTYESQTPAELYRLWRSGDLPLLARVVEEMRREYPKLYARVLAERSKAWVAPLEEYFVRNAPVMVIVGAAHLPGPDGLLALLKARGYGLKPVTAVVELPPPVSPE